MPIITSEQVTAAMEPIARRGRRSLVLLRLTYLTAAHLFPALHLLRTGASRMWPAEK
ncbi:hypothetical protein [Streptomyces longhuiensis]|uniref:hypothetical protein n=1 Tax=Streptomyces longhuiensis TaxID=2880933 RepID=UPI001D0A85EB|nr:hypothetical protein [Streptomyces longhuiensis]UDM05390.1 hypothetical protein LGI35_36185 [Streptomyces longhuiensis]